MTDQAATRHIEMRGIAKRFGGIQALRGVDFHLDPGEIVGLIGDNGAGKSTPDQDPVRGSTLPMRAKSSSTASTFGSTVPSTRSRSESRQCTRIGAWSRASGSRRTSSLGRERTRCGLLKRREMERTAKEAVEGLGIEIRSFRAPILTMSGGQQQAVAVARAVSTHPRHRDHGRADRCAGGQGGREGART